MRFQDLIVTGTTPRDWLKTILIATGIVASMVAVTIVMAETVHAAETCVTPPQPGFRVETYKMEGGKMVDCTYARLPGQAGTAPTAPSAYQLQQARDQYCVTYPSAPACQPPVYTGQAVFIPVPRVYHYWRPVWGGFGGFHHWSGGYHHHW